MSGHAHQPPEIQGRTATSDRMRVYALESLLHEVDDHGFIVVPLGRLLRLLNKGNRSAGTWKALLDAWESIEGNREDLHIFETPWQGNVIITIGPTKPAIDMAGE